MATKMSALGLADLLLKEPIEAALPAATSGGMILHRKWLR
jgi:hypothetical protein